MSKWRPPRNAGGGAPSVRDGESTASVLIEYDSADPEAAPPVGPVGNGAGIGGPIAVAVALLALVIGLGVLSSEFGESDDDEAAVPTSIAPTRTDEEIGAPGPERIELDPPPPPFDLDTLPSVPAEWIDGLRLAWVSSEGLHIRDMVTGDEVDLSGIPRIQIPPLPDDVVIVGATNESWAVVGSNVGGSGLISNTFETVRLADGVASFGFVERNADGGATVSTGTLWGPSIHPVLDVAQNAAVFVVPEQGIVVSRPSGLGEVVTMGDVTPLPRRVGRVVGASDSYLAGVHCDAVGVCTGRLSDWDGVEQAIFDANALADGLVRISPDGQQLFVWDVDEAALLSTGSEQRWSIEPEINDSVKWDPVTDRLLWVVGDQLIMLDPSEPEPQPYVVRSIGTVELSAGADLVTLSG